MDIQTKDGILLRGIPDGTPDDAIKARIERIRGLGKEGATQSAPPMFTPSGSKDLSYSNLEMLAAHPLTRFATGAAAPFIGATQLAANAVGAGAPVNEHLANLNAMTQRGRSELGSEGFDWWNAAGQAASPAYLGAAKLIPNAASTAGRIGQGAGIGAAAGATAPVSDPENYWSTKGAQTLGGAAVGALVPGAWEGAKAVGRGARNVVQPYMGQWGADQAAGRLANKTAGDLAPQVQSALENPQTLVPGSSPTAGQAAAGTNSAEFAALQQLAADRSPSVYAGPGGIEGAQNQARLAAVRSVGGDESSLNAAMAARAREAGPLYQAARSPSEYVAAPDTSAVRAKAAQLLAENPGNRELVTELKNLRSGLVAAKDDPQKVSSVIDGLKATLANKDNAFIKGQLNELRADLEKSLPGYQAAQAKFSEMSKPVNQQQIGQYLEGKLVPALSDEAKQRASVYANAMREAPTTIKRATGAPRYGDLGEVMTPQQMGTLTGVQKDLARDALLKELAAKGMPAARERIGQAIPEAPPTGMFSPIISVTRGAYNRLTGHATEKIMDDLAHAMRDPKEMARLMRNAKPLERQALVDAMMRYQGTIAPSVATQGD